MSTFKFPPSITSRPVYGTLEPRSGKHHLMIADAEGAEALFDLVEKDPDLIAHAHIMYFPAADDTGYAEKLKAFSPSKLYVGPSYSAASRVCAGYCRTPIWVCRSTWQAPKG